MKRINSIDTVRGFVMIIMALDHIRDLLHVSSLSQSTTDLAVTTPVLFFTRWITHLCAPAFVFLSGVSAWLSFDSKNNLPVTRKFLISRGLWLILLDLTIVTFGVWADVRFNVIVFGVIATIGMGFLILSLLLTFSNRSIAAIALVIIFLHNLLPILPISDGSIIKKILTPLFATGAFPYGDGKIFIIGYPPIPWLGIMLAGFAAGIFFKQESDMRKKRFLQIGSMALAIFLILRTINIYGDPVPWSGQKSSMYTFLSFINLTKYPPSLQFCLVFTGFTLLLLSAVEGMQNRFTRITTVYGKVPLFYFLAHWFIIHPIMFIMVFMQGFSTHDLVFGFNFGRPKEGSGLALWGVYVVWIGVVALMFPLCRWYGNYKTSHPEKKWLRFL